MDKKRKNTTAYVHNQQAQLPKYTLGVSWSCASSVAKLMGNNADFEQVKFNGSRFYFVLNLSAAHFAGLFLL